MGNCRNPNTPATPVSVRTSRPFTVCCVGEAGSHRGLFALCSKVAFEQPGGEHHDPPTNTCGHGTKGQRANLVRTVLSTSWIIEMVQRGRTTHTVELCSAL